MTRKEKKEELIGLFAVGAIFIGDLIDECIDFGQQLSPNQQQIIGTAEHIKVALDVLDKKGGEK